ncbi:ankyrin repeat domain-containing protein [Candidatus Mesenet endosymbiont of Phosphuga atrata]|uniref:ankyrin repeat domain-containing protein n=1 Tax=Candidatus Mesenet endosymbiont of Phosphuga atrata TaxID=3066221 RepID=UPI0030D21FDE
MSLEKQLIRAIKNRNVGKVRSLLEQGADVNAKTNDGMSAIFVAMTKNKDIVKLLLDYKADVNDKFTDFERSNDGTIVRIYTPITFMLMGKLNKRDKIDILKLLLQAGANPDTTCTYKDANDTILASILFNANPEILFLLLIFGAELKNEDLAIIREKGDLQSCFTAFETVKVMPNLGKLIEANKSRDKKENAEVIAKHINNKTERQKLIKELGAIEEGYGSDEQLSFMPEYLLDTIDHITLKSREDKGAGVVSLAQKANTFLSKLKDVHQSPNTSLAESQLKGIEPLAKRQRMEI